MKNIELVYKNMSKISNLSKAQVINFVEYMSKNGLSYSDEHGIVFFLRLSNRQLNWVERNPGKLKDVLEWTYLLNQRGENIHIIGIYLDSKYSILNGMKALADKEKPRSISWFNRDMTKFHYRRM